MSFEWQIDEHDGVSSTQDICKDLALNGASEGRVVYARSQSSGHGRHGREWISEPGNLYFSFLLKPECAAAEVGPLSLLTGVALVKVIEPIVQTDVRLKWPNDVLLDGKKCAGILLETELHDADVAWVVIGVGVNIAHAPDIGHALNDYADASVDVNAFRDAFLEQFQILYQEWQASGFEELRKNWLSYAHPKGAALSVKIGDRLESGSFHDIDAQGNLKLLMSDGVVKTITSGDVYMNS